MSNLNRMTESLHKKGRRFLLESADFTDEIRKIGSDIESLKKQIANLVLNTDSLDFHACSAMSDKLFVVAQTLYQVLCTYQDTYEFSTNLDDDPEEREYYLEVIAENIDELNKNIAEIKKDLNK